jgi:hypothetical protein
MEAAMQEPVTPIRPDDIPGFFDVLIEKSKKMINIALEKNWSSQGPVPEFPVQVWTELRVVPKGDQPGIAEEYEAAASQIKAAYEKAEWNVQSYVEFDRSTTTMSQSFSFSKPT